MADFSNKSKIRKRSNKTTIVELACNLYMLCFEDHQDDPYLRGQSQEFYSGLSTALRLVYNSHEIFSGSLIPLTKKHLIHRLGLINDLRLTQMVLKNIPDLVANADETEPRGDVRWKEFHYVGFSGSEEMMVMFIESYKTEKWKNLIRSFAYLGWVNALRAIVKQDETAVLRLRGSIFDFIEGARRKKNPELRNFDGGNSDFELIFVPDRVGQRIANGEGNQLETFKYLREFGIIGTTRYGKTPRRLMREYELHDLRAMLPDNEGGEL